MIARGCILMDLSPDPAMAAVASADAPVLVEAGASISMVVWYRSESYGSILHSCIAVKSKNYPLSFSLFTTPTIRGFNLYPTMLIDTLGVASAGGGIKNKNHDDHIDVDSISIELFNTT